MALLSVKEVGKKISDTYVVKDVSFSQEPMEKIAIAGETGSGKSTLLKMIGGYEQLDAGEIKFLGRNILGPLDKLIPGHPGTAYLGQHFELRNNYFVEEVLEYGNKLSRGQSQNIYTVCRIDHLLKRKTNQLSGGERQRVALAKILVTVPKLLLLDEPFSNLDALHRAVIKDVIHDIGETLQTTCIMIAHDAADILSWAETVIIMKAGKMIQKATPIDIYQKPVNTYCAGLFGHYNLLSPLLSQKIASNSGLPFSEKQMMVRPEHIFLNKTGNIEFKGKIENFRFYGSYYLLEIQCGDELVKVSSPGLHYQQGEEVYFSVDKEKTWFL